jgi:hypothetical protein
LRSDHRRSLQSQYKGDSNRAKTVTQKANSMYELDQSRIFVELSVIEKRSLAAK